jgi:hypothetical protein
MNAIVKRHAAMEFAVLQISAAMELVVLMPYKKGYGNKLI